MNGENFIKVGDLAKRCSVTVRTLHFYEQTGLIQPSRQQSSGHRVYNYTDVVRLQQIVSLKQIGLSLDEIKKCLLRRRWSAFRVLKFHLSQLNERMENERRLRSRLEALTRKFHPRGRVPLDKVVEAIKEIVMFEKYYTPEQLTQLKERGEKIGEKRIKEVEAEWPLLIQEVREHMERGVDPASEAGIKLAQRWTRLLHEFTGGDTGIEKSLATMYLQEPRYGEQFGVDPKIFAYIKKANEAGKVS